MTDKILKGVAGYSDIKKGFLQTEKGYYVTGFNTLITKATDKDISLCLNYAKELVSDYEDINRDLLFFKIKDRVQNKASFTSVYDIKIGKLFIGRIEIESANLIRNKTISFNYSKRVSVQEFNQRNNIKHRYQTSLSDKAKNRKKQYRHRVNKKYRK